MATIHKRGRKYQAQVCKDECNTVSATIQVYQLPEVGQKRGVRHEAESVALT